MTSVSFFKKCNLTSSTIYAFNYWYLYYSLAVRDKNYQVNFLENNTIRVQQSIILNNN